MAQKRMFSLQIVDTDAFLDMPPSSQLLYFHLSMRADDEGFIGNPNRIIKLIGSNKDDFNILVAKRFLLTFESGVVVIKHWLIHNTIRMDRFNKTTYQDEKNLLTIKENKSYTDMATDGLPTGNQMATQVKLSKVNLSKAKLSERTPAQEMIEFINNPSLQEKALEYITSKGIREETAKKEILSFISYWTEPTKNGKKQRWELQETFDVRRRLITWVSKIKELGNKKQTFISI